MARAGRICAAGGAARRRRATLPPRAGARPRQLACGGRPCADRNRSPASRRGARGRPAGEGRQVPRGAGRPAAGSDREPAAARRAAPAAHHRRPAGEAGDCHCPVAAEHRQADLARPARGDAEERVRSAAARLGRQLHLRPRRAHRPAHQHRAARRHYRRRDPHGNAHQLARVQGALGEHGVRVSEHAAETARVPGAGGEGLLPVQCRREADGEHDPHAGQDARHLHRREDQPARAEGHAGGDPARAAPDCRSGPRRAGGDAGSRGDGGEPFALARARHQVPGHAGDQPAGSGRNPGSDHPDGMAEPQLRPGAARVHQSALPVRLEAAGRHLEHPCQPAHPGEEQGKGAHPHRRPRAGDHDHRCGDRWLRFRVRDLPRRRAQAGSRAAHFPRG